MEKKQKAAVWQAALGSACLAGMGLILLARPLFNRLSDSIVKKIMTDPYDENLWEFYSAATRATPQVIVETNLRAQEGKVISRPLGSPRQFPSTDALVFNVAQLSTLPTPEFTEIDTTVTIGPRAAKPLKIEMPIMISAMAFGLGLNERAKIALAQGAGKAGTAICNGEGPFLPAERKAARKYILQYDRGCRNYDPDIIARADAVEIQMGQGALGATGHQTAYADIEPKARKMLHLAYGQPLITHARVPGIKDPGRDLPVLIRKLRDITGGVPVGAKIAAGQDLESDLAILIDVGVDFIVLDCAAAATKGSAPILQDDFGLPLVFAVKRAADYLQEQGVKDRITLIVGGGLFTPGQFLKAIALGADAVYIGSIALFAVSHTQVLKALPWEPPTQVAFAQSKYGHSFNIAKGTKALYNYLISCNEEMKEGIRALGKKSLKEVEKRDLVSLDPLMAEMLGLALASERSDRT